MAKSKIGENIKMEKWRDFGPFSIGEERSGKRDITKPIRRMVLGPIGLKMVKN
jgi:hypothetical protein